jgi:hypothetical protein
MGEFRRGFKTWCENMAFGFRRDLKLDRLGPLPPRRLAEHLGIRVWTPDEIPGLERKHRDQLLVRDSSSWSAVTLSMPDGRLIVINSAHAATRQASDLMHEIAHIVLEHEPAQMMLSPNGHMFMDSYSGQQEEEADWLGAALLVPRDAALAFLARNSNTRSAAAHFGVSEDLLVWRIQKTGVTRQLKYRRRA